MATVADVQAKVAKTSTNMDRLDAFINTRGTVTTDIGSFPTLPSVADNLQTQLNTGSANAAAAAIQAAVATAAAKTASQGASDSGAYLTAVRSLLSGTNSVGQLTIAATSRAIMAGYTNQTAGMAVYLSESGRQGVFYWFTGDMSAGVTLDVYQGIYVPPSSDTTGKSGAWVRDVSAAVFYGNWWGMKGDGSDSGSGTDNVPYFQAALDVVKTLFGGGKLLNTPGHYCFKSPLKTVNGGSAPSQVFLPATDLSVDTAEVSFLLGGETPVGSYIPDQRRAVIFHCTLSGTGGAMIGTKSISGHQNGALAAYYWQNIVFRGQPNPGITMVDNLYAPISVFGKGVTCDVANLNNGYVEPTYTDVPSIRGPANNVPLWNNYEDLAIYGWYTGIQPGELYRFDNVNISNCKWLMNLVENQHPGVVGRMVGTSFANGIKVSGRCEIDISLWDIEHASRPGWDKSGNGFTGYDIYDPNGYLRHVAGKMPGYHLHDGAPINILASNFRWTPPYPWQTNQYSFASIFTTFGNLVDARSVQELVARPATPAVGTQGQTGYIAAKAGAPAWYSMLVNGPCVAQGDLFGAWSISDFGLTTTNKVIFQVAAYYDGSPGTSGAQIVNAKNGVAQVALDINSAGVVRLPLGTKIYLGEADAKAKGVQPNTVYVIQDANGNNLLALRGGN